ncbi:MAG: hypothetical protein ACI9E1_001594 [Cryomorphaceae bacterium]|jgi:hypothetical protein
MSCITALQYAMRLTTNTLDCCKMQQGRTAARSRQLLTAGVEGLAEDPFFDGVAVAGDVTDDAVVRIF